MAHRSFSDEISRSGWDDVTGHEADAIIDGLGLSNRRDHAHEQSAHEPHSPRTIWSCRLEGGRALLRVTESRR